MNKDSTKRQSFTGHKRGNNSGGSYAHVVNGGSSVANPASLISPSPALVLDETCVIERDFSKCVMGKVKDANSISNIQTFLHDEGFVDVKPKYLGGLWVMLEFEKEESKLNLLSHTGANSWFQTLQEVAQDFVSEERIAWIDIEGVPLHAWSFETFFRIGKKWGEMLNIEDTPVASFGRKRVCILTKNPVSILESLKIHVGLWYQERTIKVGIPALMSQIRNVCEGRLEFIIRPAAMKLKIKIASREFIQKSISQIGALFEGDENSRFDIPHNLHVPLDEIKIHKTLRFVEEPLEIMDCEARSLKRSKISLVKVHWNLKCGPEFTWEHEDHMKSKYPRLFVDRAVELAS
ncbi:RNA-directed DNA polymerase, eukaryota [Tanacetum coccineum]